MAPRDPLAEHTTQLEAALVLLHRLDRLLGELPARFLPDALGRLRQIIDGPRPSPPSRVKRATAAVRVREFFESRGNRPATTQEIAAAVGAPIQTVRSILYKRNRAWFVRAGGGSGWKLAELGSPGGPLPGEKLPVG